MAVVLHGSPSAGLPIKLRLTWPQASSARTTPRVRAELQASKEKASVLAKRYGLSRTTVDKWRSRVFHYPDIESLKAHVVAFVKTYNFAKHLKALRWKTPFEAIAHAWTKDPTVFKINPRHLIPGPNN